MGADMVVEYLARVGNRQRVFDKLRIIVACRRCSVMRLQPPQSFGLFQKRLWQTANGRISIDDRGSGFRVAFGHDNVELRKLPGEFAAPVPINVILGRQHYEF